MAHKTLINGTSYNVVGGSTLVGGTSYRIQAGRTLIGGTGYSIPIVSGAKFDWGTDGEEVDAQWFTALKDFCENANPEDVEASIPIGGWKTITMTQTIWGSKTHYISVIGVNQDSDVGVTFWDSPSTAESTTGNVDYNKWFTTTTGPQSKINTWVNYFPGKESLLTIKKSRYDPVSSSYASSYNTRESATVQAWAPSFDEIQGDKEPKDIGYGSTIYNPYHYGLSESKARYNWPPAKFVLYNNSTAYPVPTRTAVTTGSGASNQLFMLTGVAKDPSSYMALGYSNRYTMGACFAIGRDLPSFLESLGWDQINDLCITVQEGGSWPIGLRLGDSKDWEFASAVLGDTKIKVRLIGIDQDQPGTLTFITDCFTNSAILMSSSPEPNYINTTSAGARYNCKLFYNNSIAKSYIRPIGRLVDTSNTAYTNYYLIGDWACIPSIQEWGYADGWDRTAAKIIKDNATTTAADQPNFNASDSVIKQVVYTGMSDEAEYFGSKAGAWSRTRVKKGSGDYYYYTATNLGARSSYNCVSAYGYRILFTIGTKYPGQQVYY